MGKVQVLKGSLLTLYRYKCGPSRLFNSKDGVLYEEKTMTCDWSTNWLPDNKLDECIWVECLNPPSPPSESKMELAFYDGSKALKKGSIFGPYPKTLVLFQILFSSGATLRSSARTDTITSTATSWSTAISPANRMERLTSPGTSTGSKFGLHASQVFVKLIAF